MMEMKITVEAPDLAASILKLAEAIASGPDPSILTPDEPLPVASYPDPTAYNALRPIMQEDAALEGKVNFLIKVLKFIIAESGFELLARIEIKDKKTGRCFR